MSYKGKAPAHRRARRELVGWVETLGVSFDTNRLRSRLLADTEGDALDAVLAAFAAWRVVRDNRLVVPESERYRLEGYVYV